MNSFRRPVLSSAISYHCVSSAAPACGSSAHSSATLRAEKKRRLESEICIFSGNLVLQALLLFLNLNINKSEHYIVCDILSDIAYDIVYDIP